MACCPYGSKPAIVLAQIASILSLILTIDGFWFTWFLGLLVVILLLSLSCAFVRPSLIVTAGVLAMLCAIGQFVFAGFIRDLFVYCDATTTDDRFGHSSGSGSGSSMHDNSNHYYYHRAECNITTWRIVAIVGGAGWLLTALLIGCVVPIMKERDPELRNHSNNNNNESQCEIPVAVAYGFPISTTESVTILPDGTKRTEIVTVHSDGSRTVTIKDESPIHP